MPKIYVMCPARLHSGGPELLHQLCYKLRQYGYDAVMLFYPSQGNEGGPDTHPYYKKYQNPVADKLDDEPENFVVFPEGMPMLLPLVKQATPILWWLSVDNYPRVDNTPVVPLETLTTHPHLLHLVQSEYAARFVIDELKIPNEKVFYLRDYLRSDFFANPFVSLSASDRLPYVLYNPLKGFEFTSKLKDAAQNMEIFKGIHWMPLYGYTPSELSLLMQHAKLYIDFGNHPGMDRIPREAAINGCCVITGKRGSAKFYEDVPIPDKYKFDDSGLSINNILGMIISIMQNYDQHIEQYAYYRDFIAQQERQFEKDMVACFSKIVAPPTTQPEPPLELIQDLYQQVSTLYNTVGDGLEYSISNYQSGQLDGCIEMSGPVHEGLRSLLQGNQNLKRALEQSIALEER